MSGHSKWSQIKRKKGLADVAKGKAFSRMAAAIAVAAKGGGDPASNSSLREAIDQAREVNMPKEGIERAIKKGTGELGGAAPEEITYEVFGPGGVAILVNCVTDNKNRSNSDIKAALNKHGGNMGGPGTVSWMFEKSAVVRIDVSGKDKDEAELFAIDAGAQDVGFEDENTLFAKSAPSDLSKLKNAFSEAGYKALSADISVEPKSTVAITDLEVARKVLKLMDALDEIEDVSEVSANFDISDEIMSQI